MPTTAQSDDKSIASCIHDTLFCQTEQQRFGMSGTESLDQPIAHHAFLFAWPRWRFPGLHRKKAFHFEQRRVGDEHSIALDFDCIRP